VNIQANIINIGSLAVHGVTSARKLVVLFRDSTAGIVERDYPKGEVVRQMYIIGNKSLLFICVTMGFLGMVMTLQSGEQINRVTGDLSQVGPEFLRLFIQDFAPTITALMLATRVGAGIAAEVGSMKVTEQIDALRLSGITPTSYLIAPRFFASLIMTYILAVFAVVVSFSAGGITAWGIFGLNPTVFFDGSRVAAFDIILGSCKAVCYGMAIPLISGHCGLEARGGSEGVGAATTSAVIGSSFAVLLIDFILSGIGFAVFGGGVQ
jgi:phospholipid/cholesterol/gamma-HCH transport system permease protein